MISTAGYAFLSGSGYSQNGQDSVDGVRYTGVNWIVTINGQEYQFANSPDSFANMSVGVASNLASYSGMPLYVVSDNNAINSEIYNILGRYASRVQSACYGPCDKDLPEKDCTENMIIWSDSAENRIYQEEKCVFIEGDLRTVDAFLYKILKS